MFVPHPSAVVVVATAIVIVDVHAIAVSVAYREQSHNHKLLTSSPFLSLSGTRIYRTPHIKRIIIDGW